MLNSSINPSTFFLCNAQFWMIVWKSLHILNVLYLLDSRMVPTFFVALSGDYIENRMVHEAETLAFYAFIPSLSMNSKSSRWFGSGLSLIVEDN